VTGCSVEEGASEEDKKALAIAAASHVAAGGFSDWYNLVWQPGLRAGLYLY
jgi:hypothetical protein